MMMQVPEQSLLPTRLLVLALASVIFSVRVAAGRIARPLG